MRRVIVLSWLTLLMTPLAAEEKPQLFLMDTTEDGRAWQAVGRLDFEGVGFCTGALIAPDLVLTAAHCLYDKQTGAPLRHDMIEFRAGWRKGRASAHRRLRRAITHPLYSYSEKVSAQRVQHDIALLELSHPIRNPSIQPFQTAARPDTGASVSVVSYAKGRSDAPSLQDVCKVLSVQNRFLVTSCSVDFGSSGAPIFEVKEGQPRIVSVVSAKAEMAGRSISIGTALSQPLAELRSKLAAGEGFQTPQSPAKLRIAAGDTSRETSAKFIKP